MTATALAPPTSRPAKRAPRPGIARVIVCVAIVLFLLGSLLPKVGDLSLVSIAGPIVLVAAVVRVMGPDPSTRKLVLAVAVLFAILLIGASYGPGPLGEYGEDKLSRLHALTPLSALAAVAIRPTKDLRTFAGVWLCVGLVLAVFTFLGGELLGSDRSAAFDSNPIWTARALAAATLFAVWLGITDRRHRPQAVLCIPVLVTALIMTGSRGPALGLLIGVLVLVVAIARGSRKVNRLVVALISLFLAYVALLLIPGLAASRIGQSVIGGTGDSELTGRNRLELWTHTWQVIQDHPGGVGPGNWPLVVPTEGLKWPHNIWLESLVEFGWIPGLALIAFTATIMVKLFVRARQSPVAGMVLAGLCAEATSVSFSGDINARTFFFMLFLGFVTLMSIPNTVVPEGDSESAPAATAQQSPTPLTQTPEPTVGHGSHRQPVGQGQISA